MTGTAKTSEWNAAEIASLLRWYLEAGVDEAIGEQPVDRTAPLAPRPAPAVPAAARSGPRSPAPAPEPPLPMPADPGLVAAPQPRSAAAADALEQARAANSLEQLCAAVASFEGCPLKRTAMNLCFGRGSATARVVVVGEAPGQDEDRQGRPFVGASGKLLDRILASVGLDEATVFITNTVFWRPPGNREPTDAETQACLPFVRRIIELIAPEVLVTLGGPAAKTLLNETAAMARLRGRWFEYTSAGLARPVTAMATYHPAYLLRSPAQKRLVWRDMLALQAKLTR